MCAPIQSQLSLSKLHVVSFAFGLAMTMAFSETEVSAQVDTNSGLAEELFEDAQHLMTQQRYTEACPKFAESQRLDPGAGTLLNLGVCHEAEGKTATAWGEINAARAQAEQAGRMDRVKFADEHIKALASRLCRLTIEVSEEARVDDLEIDLDGNLLKSAAWGVPAPVDPGTHVIHAVARGKRRWSRSIELKGDADRSVVEIPVLLDLRVADPSLPTPSASPKSDDAALTGVYWMGGTTLLLAAGAGVTGAVYLSKKSTYQSKNNNALASDHDRRAAESNAKKFGIANIAFTGGATLGATITAVMYFTRSRQNNKSATVSPWLEQQAVGLSASGSF